MKVSNFIKYELKKRAPLFIVISIYCFVFGILTNSKIFGYGREFIFSSVIFPTLLIPAYVIPFFNYKDQFNKNMADTINAFPANKYQINRIKILIGLVFIGALSLFLHLCCIIDAPSAYKVSYFVAFLFMVLSLAVLYLFNCTLVSLGNSLVTSLLYVGSGALLSFGVVPTIFLIFGWATDITNILSMFGGAVSTEYILVQIEAGYKLLDNAGFVVLYIFMYLVIAAVGALAFFIKQPSGEYYGMPGERNKHHKIIIYSAIGLAHVFIGAILGRLNISFLGPELNIAIYVSSFIWSYIVLVIFNKKFKIGKIDWIVLASVELAGILIRIILTLIH